MLRFGIPFKNDRSSTSKSILSRLQGNTAVVALMALLCSSASSSSAPQRNTREADGGGFFTPGESIGPDVTGLMVGALVGIGAVATVAVLVSVNHSHHTLKGCVVPGAQGLQLQTSDSKAYLLEGNISGINTGDRIKLHGSKMNKANLSSGAEVFTVQKIQKNYGPCRPNPKVAPNPGE